MVVVSCVEEKEPYRCHPHKLVGKDGMCKKGVCSMDINTPEMTATFQVRYIPIETLKRLKQNEYQTMQTHY